MFIDKLALYLTAALFASTALTTTILPTPTYASIFDWFNISETTIDCPIRDRSCILEKAVAISMASNSRSKAEHNTYEQGKRAAILALLYPADQRTALRKRWEEGGADAEFFEEYD